MKSNNNLRCVIVDDEEPGAMSLKIMLGHYCPEVEVLDVCCSAQTAYESICKNRPNLLFLDIEMPNQNGFSLLGMFTEIDFHIIFITAHEKYALSAIKHNAEDYILKPVRGHDLIQSISKIKAKENGRNKNESVNSQEIPKLVLPTRDKFVFLPIDEIVRLEADANYSKIYIKKPASNVIETIVSSKNLGEYEAILNKYLFVRVHRSHLLNFRFVKIISKTDGGYIEMKDSTIIPISEAKKETISALLTNSNEFLSLP